MAYKLERYLLWLGYETKQFNISNFLRKNKKIGFDFNEKNESISECFKLLVNFLKGKGEVL